MKTEDALREWGNCQGRQDKPDDFWDKSPKRGGFAGASL